jgi:hypothetical protein
MHGEESEKSDIDGRRTTMAPKSKEISESFTRVSREWPVKLQGRHAIGKQADGTLLALSVRSGAPVPVRCIERRQMYVRRQKMLSFNV